MRTKIYLLLIALVVTVGSVWGQTFTYEGLNYNITDEIAKTVEVAKNSYSGDLTIPSTVQFGDDFYSVKSIVAYAFSENRDLTSVVIPDGIETIGNAAFLWCSNLVSATINTTTLETIPDGMFQRCPALTEITIPEGVKTIRGLAFLGCEAMVTVNLPSTLKTIVINAFDSCTGVKFYNVTASANPSPPFRSEGGVLYNGAMTTIVRYPLGSEASSFTIPKDVTNVGTTLVDAANLENIIVHDESAAFSSSDNGMLLNKLGTILIVCPAGKGGDLVIPDGIVTVNDRAFEGCKNLTKISIPSSVQFLNVDFTFRNCDNLVGFEVADGNDFFVTDQHGVLFNKDMNRLVAYPNARHDDDYEVPSGVLNIANDAFYTSLYVKNIKLPDGLTSIGRRAFFDSRSLESINLPNTITSVGDNFFTGCVHLKDVNIPDNNLFTTVVNRMFTKTESLTSIEIPKHITAIGTAAFEGSGIENITLPDGLTTIGERAFVETNLTSIVIPENVSSIGTNAFDGSLNLKEITFLIDDPTTMTIGADAFYGIAEDAYIIIPAGKKDEYVQWTEDNNLPFTADNIYEAATVVVDPAKVLKFIEAATGKVLDKLPQAATGKDYIILPKDDNNYEVTDVKVNGDTADRNTDGQFYVTLDGNKDIKVTVAPKEVVIITIHKVTIEHLAGTSVSKSLSSYEVEEGGAFSFTAIATDATSAVTVYVNGTELAPTSDDFYYIDGITEDLLITFSLPTDDNTTANEVLSTAKISASTGAITIEAPQTVAVQIISFAGQIVYSSDIIRTTVNVPSGIYAVVIDRKATKIVVR